MCRDSQPPLATDLHARHSHFPTFDHMTAAQSERERLPAVVLIDDLVVLLQTSSEINKDLKQFPELCYLMF